MHSTEALIVEHRGLALGLARSEARHARHLAEELESLAELELCVAASEFRGDASGFPEYARGRVGAALAAFARSERTHARRQFQPDDHRAYEASPESRRSGLASLLPARTMTPGQGRRFRRNLCIAVAARAGMSRRALAGVFGLPRSRIAEIVREIESLAGDGGRPWSP